MSRVIAVASLSALLFAGVARAADLPMEIAPTPGPVAAPAAAPIDENYDWTGFHVGAFAGYNWNHVQMGGPGQPQIVQPEFAPLSIDPRKFLVFDGGKSGTMTANGAMLGGQLGYDHQFGSVVAGVEADLAHNWAKDRRSNQGYEWGADIDWSATVRGRVGYAWDRVLPYVTAGLAVSKVDARYADGSGTYKDSKTRAGLAVGGGVEAALTDSISIKGEYLFSDFGDKQKVNPGVDHVEVTGHAAKIGLNYRFNLD